MVDNWLSRVYLEECVYVYLCVVLSLLQILCKAITKGQLSQPVQSRLACCMILGKASSKVEPFV